MSTFPKCCYPNCEANKKCIPGLKYYSLENEDTGTAKWIVLMDRDQRSRIMCERHYPNIKETSDSIDTTTLTHHNMAGSFVGVSSTTSETPSTSMPTHDDLSGKQKFMVMPLETRDMIFRVPQLSKPQLLIISNAYPGIQARLAPDPGTNSQEAGPPMLVIPTPTQSLQEIVKPREVRRVPASTNVTHSHTEQLSPSTTRYSPVLEISAKIPLPGTKTSQPKAYKRRLEFETTASTSRIQDLRTSNNASPVGNTNTPAVFESTPGSNNSPSVTISAPDDKIKEADVTDINQPINFSTLKKPLHKAATNTKLNSAHKVNHNRPSYLSIIGNRLYKAATNSKSIQTDADIPLILNPPAEPALKGERPTVPNIITSQQEPGTGRNDLFHDAQGNAPGRRYNTNISATGILNSFPSYYVQLEGESKQEGLEGDMAIIKEIIELPDPFLMHTGSPSTSKIYERSESVQMLSGTEARDSAESRKRKASNLGHGSWSRFMNEIEDDKRVRTEGDDNYDEA